MQIILCLISFLFGLTYVVMWNGLTPATMTAIAVLGVGMLTCGVIDWAVRVIFMGMPHPAARALAAVKALFFIFSILQLSFPLIGIYY